MPVSAFGHYVSSKLSPEASFMSGTRQGGKLPRSKTIIDMKGVERRGHNVSMITKKSAWTLGKTPKRPSTARRHN